jgi:Ni/Fe-hydrogenase subunit HybB-like protein
MATKTQFRFTIALAVGFAALSIVMPDAADAFFRRRYRGAPEVDPSTLSSAIALAMGGLAVLGDKLRRR